MGRVFDEQNLHLGVFGGVVNTVMEGRLCASDEYADLLASLVGRVSDAPFRHSASKIIRDEVASRDTVLMKELFKVLDANWADLTKHFAKHRNAGRPVYAAVKRIRKSLARA